MTQWRRLRLVLYVFLSLLYSIHATTTNSAATEYVEDDKPILLLPKQNGKYKTYLSLDGGGMKGLISSMVLQELVDVVKSHFLRHVEYLTGDYRIDTMKDFHIDIADYFDAIAGISAGSWIATYLASKGGNGASREVFRLPHIVNRFGSIRPGSVTGLQVFFLEYGMDIYPPRTIPLTMKPRLYGLPLIGVSMATEPKYRPEGLEWVLTRFLGDTKLSEVHTSLMICAFDLLQRSSLQFVADNTNVSDPVIYTNVFYTRAIPRQDDDDWEPDVDRLEKLDYFIRDLTRASSAFPMIHGSKSIKPLNTISSAFDVIDGAMVGNNPTLQQMVWVMSNEGRTLDNSAFLSLGTGATTGQHTSIGEGGVSEWLGPMVSLLMGATPEYLDGLLDLLYYKVANAKPNQYLRVQAAADDDTPEGQVYASLDNLSLLEDMKDAGRRLGAVYRSNLELFVKDFMFED